MNFDDYQTQINTHLNALVLPKNPENLYQSMRYMLDMPSKRIRPTMVLMACHLFDKSRVEQAISAALGIELFHNFTLIHDDIMDKSPLRRGNATLHTKYNESTAILSGDTMFVKSLELISKVDDRIFRNVFDVFCQTATEVCEGQQMDMDFETRTDVSVAQYVAMIALKTSVLLGCSMKIGALIGGANADDAQHLYDFGKNIGIAFQFQDDILDVFGTQAKVGKQIGGDIIANKNTFLKIKSYEMATSEQKQQLDHFFYDYSHPNQVKVQGIKALYETLNVKQLSVDEMQNYLQNANACLEKITYIEPEKIGELKVFAQYLIERDV